MSPAETIAEPSATIIDAVSLIQNMKGNDILSTCRLRTDSHITRRSQESHNRCGIRYTTRRLDQERGYIEQGVTYRNAVPKHGAMSPDPAVEICSQ